MYPVVVEKGSSDDEGEPTVGEAVEPNEHKSCDSRQYGDVSISGTWSKQLVFQGDQLIRCLTTAYMNLFVFAPTLTGTKLGIQALIGEFHALMNLGKQIGIVFDKDRGKADVGSYANLRLAVKRLYAKKPWKADFDANERFLNDVVNVEVVGFALKFFGMENTSSPPSPSSFPPLEEWKGMNQEQKADRFHKAIADLVESTWTMTHDWKEDADVLSPTDCLAKISKELKQRHYCKKGCGKHFQKQYARHMKDHLKECTYEGPDLTPTDAEVDTNDYIHNYHLHLLNVGMLFESFQHYIFKTSGSVMARAR